MLLRSAARFTGLSPSGPIKSVLQFWTPVILNPRHHDLDSKTIRQVEWRIKLYKSVAICSRISRHFILPSHLLLTQGNYTTPKVQLQICSVEVG